MLTRGAGGRYVNDAIYTADGSQILSSSSDGTVRVWNVKTTECVATFRPPQQESGTETTINSVHLYPKNTDQVRDISQMHSSCTASPALIGMGTTHIPPIRLAENP
jgi:WD40 repeat protein